MCLALIVAAGAVSPGVAGCGSSSRTGSVDATGDAGTAQLDAGGDAGAADAPTCPASCDDKNDCTIDSCDPLTYQCVHAPVADGTKCEDGNTCTINDICQGGLCFSGPYKSCTAIDHCHEAGVCSPKTGECSNPNSANGKACDDGSKCTYSDQCNAGVCAGTPLVCVGSATCDPASGTCPGFPTALSAQIFENVMGPTNGNGLVRTPDGRIFLAGSFFNTTDLGSGSMTTDVPRGQSNTDLFIAQLDPSAEKALWTQTFPGPQAQYVTTFAANGAGQLGIVGSLNGGFVFATDVPELDALYDGDQYILGASSTDGSGQWARRVNLGTKNLGSTISVGLHGIAGDPQTNAFVVCGTANKDGTDLDPTLKGQWQGGTDVVLARVDGATGATTWATQVGGTNNEDCASVATDAQSNLYVVGSYRFGSVVKFGSLDPLPMVDNPNAAWMLLAKLDSAGHALWARGLGTGQQAIVPTAMLVLGNDDVVLAGAVQSGDLTLEGQGLGGNTFVGRFSGATGHAWIKGIGVAGSGWVVTVTAMAEGADGGVLMTGNYFNSFTLGATTMPAPDTLGGTFVVQLDSNGGVRGAKGYGDPTYGNGAVGVIGRTDGTGDEKDSSLLLTWFQGAMQLGQPVGLLNASSTKTTAMCVAKLAP
jgi:Beta-propeller repeat